MNRIDRGIKKLEMTFLKEAKRWARNLSIKQKGMDIDDLCDSFTAAGYTLNYSRLGTEWEMELIRGRDKKAMFEGTVMLDIDLRKDTAYYEGK
ncbi:MAG: hypothetical protein ACE3L7_14505 [Candidatus Pristimantibacillus sp.]